MCVFEELSEVYGYRPNVRPRVLYDNENRQYDPLEPQPGPSTSEPAASSKQPGPSTPSRKKQKSTKKDTYQEAEASRQEEQKLLVVKQQHEEKMQMFKGFLDGERRCIMDLMRKANVIDKEHSDVMKASK